MKIENKITTAVINTLQALYGITPDTSTVQLQKTKKEFEGHLTLVVFPFLKASRKNPEATATEIGEYLVKNESAVASYNVIKGFLNLVIASNCWIDQLNDINENEQENELSNYGAENNLETIRKRKENLIKLKQELIDSERNKETTEEPKTKSMK